jgi:hypothetical protein
MIEKIERNNEIVKLRDDVGWTFPRIAEYYKIKKPTVFKAYQRAKIRLSKASESYPQAG